MRCADTSGCEGTFTETEIQRFLDEKTYEWFDKVRTRNEIRKVQKKFYSISILISRLRYRIWCIVHFAITEPSWTILKIESSNVPNVLQTVVDIAMSRIIPPNPANVYSYKCPSLMF